MRYNGNRTQVLADEVVRRSKQNGNKAFGLIIHEVAEENHCSSGEIARELSRRSALRRATKKG